ncbi:non-ribosomal peptide synthetase component F/thioesterase domain-containing protein [Bradyrhizobium sp. F1.4.3]|uniref:condensation domain-containing protein n=1 Tax=Bradyrhizobium sp. F1.4.3 TaxID=3156356 RepID=UPI003390A4B7
MAKIIKLPNVNREVGDRREIGTNQYNLMFPLSAAQARIWRADRQRPGDPAHNCAFRWRLNGPLDSDVVERAFNEVVARHEILRATFSQIGGDPVQIIAPTVELLVGQEDLRRVSDAERQSLLEGLCRDEATRGFDIGTGPLVRVRLVRTEEQQYYLLLTLHLLIADGWSIRVILTEFCTLYSALAIGFPPSLPSLALHYPDYVVWQREQRSQKEILDQLAYWRSKLSGYNRLEVAPDLTPPSELTRSSDIVALELPRTLTDALNALANRQGGTMFTVAFAACKALLCRYTGRTDIAVGSELAGRNRTELESLVGLFINHVAFRTDISGNPRFEELAARVRDTTFEIFANQDVAFEDVLNSIGADDVDCPEPFVHVNFNCYRAFGEGADPFLGPSKVRVTPVPSFSQGALYRLNFFMVERESGWRLSIEFSKDYYSRQFALQMLENFRDLLQQIVLDPQQKLSEFNLSGVPAPSIDPSDNATNSGAAEDELYVMPASVVQERFWLLGKLDPTSPKFHMRATVRVTGALSPALLEQSFQSLIDRHEILRTNFVEQDGRLVQVIAPARPFSLSVVSLPNLAEADRDERLKELLFAEARQPFDLEGSPLLRAALFCFQPDDFVLLITTHHIIADGWSQRIVQDELWAVYDALAASRDPALAPLPIQFADFAAWQKDWLSSPVASAQLSYWQKQLQGPIRAVDFPTDRPAAMRMTSNGAIESLVLPSELAESLRKLSRSEGVTMFTVTLACFAILIERCSRQSEMVIGSPVANRRAETEPLIGPFSGPIPFRFDLSGNPTLSDVLRQVSRISLEALDQVDLPFEALLDHLRVQSANGRSVFFQFYFMYQTAFLQARSLPGLTIAPMPTFSVGTPFELQLAMIERPNELRVNFEYNAELFDKESVRALLAYYETILRAMASTTDRAVADLGTPDIWRDFRASPLSEAKAPVHYVPPRTDDEIKLVELWKEILKVSEIGAHDNFFDLGGHSLLAAQLVARLQAEFGVTIDLSLLIVAPTVELLARKLRQSSQEDRRPHVVTIREGGHRRPLFCIHAGGGHLLDYRDMIDALPSEVPVYGLRASEQGDPVPESVERLATQYLREMQDVQPNGPYQICGLSFGGLLAFEISRQLVENGEQVSLVALFDTGNWDYYRNLPAEKAGQFRQIYMKDRIKKYGRNLIQGRLQDIWADARLFVTSKSSVAAWKMGQKICRLFNLSMPRFARSNIVMFSAVGKNYVPKTYRGELLLFRADGRSAEYGDDLTLGWTNIARDGVLVHQVPGSHLSIMRKPYVDRLVELLTPYLADGT